MPRLEHEAKRLLNNDLLKCPSPIKAGGQSSSLAFCKPSLGEQPVYFHTGIPEPALRGGIRRQPPGRAVEGDPGAVTPSQRRPGDPAEQPAVESVAAAGQERRPNGQGAVALSQREETGGE